MNHVFDIEHARVYGIAEAVMIGNFQFWIAKNRANRENFHDGRTWTYNSVKAFTELFPYLSAGQIRRTLERLVELGVLVTGTFNERAVDRTKWYAFYDECTFLPQQKHLSESANASAEIDKSLYKTDVNTDVNTDNPPAKRAVSGRKKDMHESENATPMPAKFDPAATLAEAGVPRQQVADWLAIRKAKRLPLTLTAWEQMLIEVQKARMTVPDAVQWCCFKGWAGFEARYMDARASGTGGARGAAAPQQNFDASMSNAARAKAKLFGPKR